MKRQNKKGFTIVELVIVIAVIAILAAVLIPTFSSVIKKAKISADTQVVRNMNTTLSVDEVVNGTPEDFNAVVKALKEDGYVISNLNPTTNGWFYVWESTTNQILLVDETYTVRYASEEGYPAIGNTWHFAISNATVVAQVEKYFADNGIDANIRNTVSKATDLKGLLAKDGADVYIDESVVLDADNRLLFDTAGVSVTVNLGDSQLTSNGTIGSDDSRKFPIHVKQGTVTLNGGIVGASGAAVDLDGKKFATPFYSAEGTDVTINGTKFYGTKVGDTVGGIEFAGKAVLNGVVTDTYFYPHANAEVVLNDCVSNIATSFVGEPALWVTNTFNGGPNGTVKLTINSGNYSADPATGWGTVSMHGGTIEIKGGDFNSNSGKMFAIVGAKPTSCIIISGGTFNGVAFESVTDWASLFAGACNVTTNADGSITITAA